MGAEELTAVAVTKLRYGAQPLQEPERIWGGRSGGGLCDLCGTPIVCGQQELEAVGTSGAARFYHPACFDALSEARALRGASE